MVYFYYEAAEKAPYFFAGRFSDFYKLRVLLKTNKLSFFL